MPSIRPVRSIALAAGLCAALVAPLHAAHGAHAATTRAHSATSDSIVFYSAQGYDSAMAKAFQ